MKQTSKPIFVLMIAILLAACGTVSSFSTVTVTATPSLPPMTPTGTFDFFNPTNTATHTNTPTATPEPGIAVGCQLIGADKKLFVISYKEFYAIGPGAKKLDQILSDHFPKWARYRQAVSWSTTPEKLGEIINSGSTNVTSWGVNSSVALVTLGEIYRWEIPEGKDLFSVTEELSQELFYLAWDWANPENQQLRDRYPYVSNEATYAVYAFFDYDQEKLQSWCEVYLRLFGVSSLD